jgi:hypothetical protein
MKMIGHQTVGVDLQVIARCCFDCRVQENLPIRIVLENVGMIGTAVHHMVPSARKIFSSWTGH